MENGLPGKGIVLTQISNFWFEFFADKVPHHLIGTDVRDVPGLSEEERQALKVGSCYVRRRRSCQSSV